MRQMWTEKEIQDISKKSFNLLDHGYSDSAEPSDEIGKDGELYIRPTTNEQGETVYYLYIKMSGHWLKIN